MLLVDDKSRFMWIGLLGNMDQASTTFKQSKDMVEVETRWKIKVFRANRGGEFTFLEFGNFCAEIGFQRQLTAPYSPQQMELRNIETKQWFLD